MTNNHQFTAESFRFNVVRIFHGGQDREAVLGGDQRDRPVCKLSRFVNGTIRYVLP